MNKQHLSLPLPDGPHRRYNPLTGEWVLVSPHRNKRPWQGKMEKPDLAVRPRHDPNCYLCPGATRAGGEVNPDYSSVFVFTNDFSALLPQTGEAVSHTPHPLFRAEPEAGLCRVICYSPRHDLAMALLEESRIMEVIQVWQQEYSALGEREDISHVQIFENRGELMGCSNPHPHGQVWATQTIPDIPLREAEHQLAYHRAEGSCLLCDYADLEHGFQQRLILENDSFLALVPYWAVWPFEAMILPRRHMASILELNSQETADLACIMRGLAIRFDNLFQCPFPYSMGIHQAPTDCLDHGHWHWHMHFYPPLLRSQTVRKFMVGFEMMAMPQRDLTAETAAAGLAQCPPVHYLGHMGEKA